MIDIGEKWLHLWIFTRLRAMTGVHTPSQRVILIMRTPAAERFDLADER
jgi:hypothetical protein